MLKPRTWRDFSRRAERRPNGAAPRNPRETSRRQRRSSDRALALALVDLLACAIDEIAGRIPHLVDGVLDIALGLIELALGLACSSPVSLPSYSLALPFASSLRPMVCLLIGVLRARYARCSQAQPAVRLTHRGVVVALRRSLGRPPGGALREPGGVVHERDRALSGAPSRACGSVRRSVRGSTAPRAARSSESSTSPTAAPLKAPSTMPFQVLRIVVSSLREICAVSRVPLNRSSADRTRERSLQRPRRHRRPAPGRPRALRRRVPASWSPSFRGGPLGPGVKHPAPLGWGTIPGMTPAEAHIDGMRSPVASRISRSPTARARGSKAGSSASSGEPGAFSPTPV